MPFEVSRQNPILKAFCEDLIRALAHEQVLATQRDNCMEAMVKRDSSIVSIQVSELSGFQGGYYSGDDEDGALGVRRIGVSVINIRRNKSPFFPSEIIASSVDMSLREAREIATAPGVFTLQPKLSVMLEFLDRTHEQFPGWDIERPGKPSARAFKLSFSTQNPLADFYMTSSEICRNNILWEAKNFGFTMDIRYNEVEDKLADLSLNDLIAIAKAVNAIREREGRKADGEIIIPATLIRAGADEERARYAEDPALPTR